MKLFSAAFLPLVLSGWGAAASADITVDHASAVVGRQASRSLTWTHTLGPGADRALVVGVVIDDGRRRNADIARVTFGGRTMHTVPDSYAAGLGGRVLETQLFYLTGTELPGPGRYDVAVRFDSTADDAAGGAVSLFGIQPGAPAAAAHNVEAPGFGPIRTPIAAPVDSWIVDVVASEGNANLSPGHGQVEQFDENGHVLRIAGSTRPASPSGTTVLSWDQRGPSRLATSAVAFRARPKTFTLAVSSQGSGTVGIDPPGTTYVAGTHVTLTATPAAGWQFAGWSGDLTGTANPATLTMDGNKSVTATFTRIFYSLQTAASGSGSVTVDPPGATQPALSIVTLTAVPGAGWHFVQWQGGVTATTSPVTLLMDGDKAVTAVFAPNTRTLTRVVSGSGSVTADPDLATYTEGTTVTLTAVPDTGWQFAGWGGDLGGNANPATLVLDTDKSVMATFTRIPPPVIGTPPTSQAALVGTDVTFGVVASGVGPFGYQWRKNGIEIAGATADTLLLPAVQLADAGSYAVTVSNAGGSTTSLPASLSVTSTGGLVLVNDSFADGERLNFAPPDSATWLKAQNDLNTVVTVAPGSARFALNATSSEMLAGYFSAAGSPVSLGVGDTLTLSVTVTLGGLGTTAAGLRFGLLDSKGSRPGDSAATANAAYIGDTGYGLFTNIGTAGGGTAFTLNRRTTITSNAIFTTGADFTTIGSGGGTARPFTDNTDYVLTYSISRLTATQTRLTSSVVGGALGTAYSFATTETSPSPYTTFDYFGWRVASNAFASAITFKNLSVTLGLVPPAITTQPTGVSTVEFDTVVLGAAASGSGPLTFQWSKDGVPIAGANSPTLTLASVRVADSGAYTLTATNPVGSVTSAVAAVVVGLAPPLITTQPLSQTILVGEPATFSVAVRGSVPFAYQWRKGGLDISGAIGPSFTIPSLQLADSGTYTVLVTNGAGSVSSDPATLLVTTSPVPPSITVPPASTSVVLGHPVQLRVVAAGTTPLSYQWSKDGQPIAGATSAVYAIAAATTGDAGAYTVTVTNAPGTITSAPAVLTVIVPPAIVTPPSSQLVNAGAPATFSVVASGSAPLAYQWLKNGGALGGATGATLSLGPVQAADAGAYSVVVSNGGGSVTSAAASLVVADPGLAVATLFPAPTAAGLPVDVPLRISFGIPPTLGPAGRIQVRDVATSAVVDTIDLSAATQTRTIGGTVYNYLPVIVSGNDAQVTLHAPLAYNKTYAVTVEPGVFQTPNGVFAGITSDATWRFTTRPAPPAADSASLVVAADGSGDFATVQGAIDFVPAGNAQRRVLFVRRGLYQELIHVANRPLVTLRGEDRRETVVAYANNANFNPSARSVIGVDAADVTIENLTVRNLTPKGGSQAETIRTNGARFQLRRADLYSFQDTLQLNGSAYVESSYIEGDVDFMWGNAAAYFAGCELRNVTSSSYYVQARTPAGQPGFVYVGSRLSGNPGVSGTWLARIDPSVFPDSQVVYIDSAMGPQIAAAGWLLNNASSSSTVRLWEFGSTDLQGTPVDVSARIASSRQLTDGEAAQWRDSSFVLGGWVPQTVPFLAAPPVSQTVSAGQDVVFAAGALAVPAPSYEWRKDGSTIPGATGPTLLLPAVQADAAGAYSVVVSNAAGSVTSAPATLNVSPLPGAPILTTSPAAQTASIGDGAAFSVAASGSPVLSYQWSKDGAPIVGATSPTLALGALQLADAGLYAVVVGNGTGSVASVPVALTVRATPIPAAPSILAPPASQLAFAGSTVTLTVVARGVPAPSYQWLKDGTPIAGATGATLTLSNVQLASSGSYVVVVTNALGSATSDPAVLTVFTPANLITQQPQGQGVNIGETAAFTVVASGSGPLHYQWRRNGVTLPGTDTDTLTVPNAQPGDTAVYSVLVTSGTEAELSDPATLTVSSPDAHLPPVETFNLEGFAAMGSGTTGGGLVDPADAAHYKVIDAATANPAQTLRSYLESTGPLVVEVRTDVDLGALNNQTRRPLVSPELIASGLGVIRVASNKTLFSDRGATLRHGTLMLDGSQNVIIRNLKFRGLWEWDDATQGQYDLQGWDFVSLTNGARNVWIDHCDFAKVYDGQIDVVRGSDLVTVSWNRVTGDLGTEVATQIGYLEGLYLANPADPRISYYASLRQAQSAEDIVTHEIPQDKTSLVGNDDSLGAIDTGHLNVTYHHDAFVLVRQRTPRMRFGNAHVYDIFVDDTLSAPFPGTQTAVNSTTGAAVLVENSDFREVLTPLMFSNGGRISQRGSAWVFGGTPTPFDPARLDPVDPDALVFNPPSSFAWPDLAHLPYAYTLDPADFTRTHLDDVGTIVPADETGRALLRGYFKMAGPFTPAPPPAVTYPLTVAVSGSGTVAANPALSSYVAGSTVTLTAIADPGWQFSGWSGDVTGTTNPTSIVMDSEKVVLATFVPSVVPPTITDGPHSQTANVGDTVLFGVTATGTAPLSYQWRKGGSDIPGATSADLTLVGVQTANAGSYTVTVSNAAGSATSAPAILTVVVPSTAILQERFADGDRTTQNLPSSAAWFSSSGGSNFTAIVGQATQIVSSARTLLAYVTGAAGTPVTIGAGHVLTLDFTVQFSGFDTGAGASPNTFVVGLLRSVANPAATSGTGFTADGPPNTVARVTGDFGSNNPTSNQFTLYGGYAAMTTTGPAGVAAPVRLYARTGSSASLLNSASPFTPVTGPAATPSTAMAVNTDYHGTMTLQNTGGAMTMSYALRDASSGAVVMSYSVVQPAATSTEVDTVAFYVSKATASATYNLVIKAVDVTLF